MEILWPKIVKCTLLAFCFFSFCCLDVVQILIIVMQKKVFFSLLECEKKRFLVLWFDYFLFEPKWMHSYFGSFLGHKHFVFFNDLEF